jgi:hypothetical protein
MTENKTHFTALFRIVFVELAPHSSHLISNPTELKKSTTRAHFRSSSRMASTILLRQQQMGERNRSYSCPANFNDFLHICRRACQQSTNRRISHCFINLRMIVHSAPLHIYGTLYLLLDAFPHIRSVSICMCQDMFTLCAM